MEKEERERVARIVLPHDERFRIVATCSAPRSGRGEEEVPGGEADLEGKRRARKGKGGGEMRIERKGRKEERRGREIGR